MSGTPASARPHPDQGWDASMRMAASGTSLGPENDATPEATVEEEAALVREAVGTHTAHSPRQAGGTELLEPQLIFTKK